MLENDSLALYGSFYKKYYGQEYQKYFEEVVKANKERMEKRNYKTKKIKIYWLSFTLF